MGWSHTQQNIIMFCDVHHMNSIVMSNGTILQVIFTIRVETNLKSNPKWVYIQCGPIVYSVLLRNHQFPHNTWAWVLFRFVRTISSSFCFSIALRMAYNVSHSLWHSLHFLLVFFPKLGNSFGSKFPNGHRTQEFFFFLIPNSFKLNLNHVHFHYLYQLGTTLITFFYLNEVLIWGSSLMVIKQEVVLDVGLGDDVWIQ